MTYVPLTQSNTIAPILAFLDRVGVPRDRLFATAKLPPWIMADREALIPALATRLPPVAPTEIPGDVEDWISSAPSRDFAASIRQAVETLSRGENYPSVRQTADFVGMSVRTLQRRLAQAGASHHMLVAQARFATAAAVLERTDHKILDLALDLGYSDHANFTRAFRRWAGCAPGEYQSRKARRQRVAPSPPRSRGGGQAASAPDPPICVVSSRTHAAQNDKETARSKVA